MKISYSGSDLRIGDYMVETPWSIREAFEIDGRVIVLMDQFSHLKAPIRDISEIRALPKGRNLFCYSDRKSVV